MSEHDTGPARPDGLIALGMDPTAPGTPEQAAAGRELSLVPGPRRAGTAPAGLRRGDGRASQASEVAWVRPSELAAAASARVAGRGIDFQAELARRVRGPAARAMGASVRAAGRRARRLPPAEAFGARHRDPRAAGRGAIGLR